jgi:hypothetical protein
MTSKGSYGSKNVIQYIHTQLKIGVNMKNFHLFSSFINYKNYISLEK